MGIVGIILILLWIRLVLFRKNKINEDYIEEEIIEDEPDILFSKDQTRLFDIEAGDNIDILSDLEDEAIEEESRLLEDESVAKELEELLK